LPFQSRILDAGCAGGGLLAALQRRGYRKPAGVDPPPATCAQLPRGRIGAAWQGWPGKLPSGIGTFDCVVLYHVLGQILDVPPALDILRRLMSGRGIVYVKVPGAARYAKHISRFSRRCWDNALGRRGFAPVGGGARVLRPSAHNSMPAVHGVYQWRGQCLCRTGIDARAAIRKQNYFNNSGGLTWLNRPREPLGFQGRSPWPDFWC
jgi:SAM-dependent methyltransferase